jgi:osmotically-inducible protein OsmY
VSAEPVAYFVERVREALAHDPRVSELGICVTVAGDHVLLTGDVATAERKSAVAEVVGPLLGGRTLENAVTVASLGEVDTGEDIP